MRGVQCKTMGSMFFCSNVCTPRRCQSKFPRRCKQTPLELGEQSESVRAIQSPRAPKSPPRQRRNGSSQRARGSGTVTCGRRH